VAKLVVSRQTFAHEERGGYRPRSTPDHDVSDMFSLERR